ncbi:MAG: extracellular solute-binding protein [Clostridia bacterium]|nr:extracellular solute-binding protein [Clostridia bacterium]
MIKRFLSLTVLLLVLLPTLFACHGSRDKVSFVIPENFNESKNYEITFWAKNDTNVTQTAIYNKAITDFEALYPNIKVNLRLYTDYGKIYNDVITNIATDTTPNVCITYPDHIATYMTGEDTVVPLDGLFSHPEYGFGGTKLKYDGPTLEEMVPKFLSECILGDEHYAIPYMRSTEACYVNKTYVEALGYTLPEILTWDFVWEVSEAAMATDDNGNFIVNGQQVLIPFIYKSSDNMMIQYLKQSGGNYSTPDGEVQIFNDHTKDFLYTISAHTKTKAFSTFKISGYPANFLNAGQCIFAVDSTAGATWMGSNAPLVDISEDRIVEFETVVMPIPQADPENPRMISQGPSICIFNKEDSGEVLASWIFAQYLLTNEVQISYSQTEGYAPVTLKAQNSPEYLDYLSREGEDNQLYYDIKIKAVKLLMENTDNTFVTPVFNGSASLRDAAGQLIEEVTKSTRRKKTVDEKFMAELYANMKSLYRLEEFSAKNSSDNNDLSKEPLPTTSVILLSSIAGVWVLMGVYLLITRKKREN